MSQELLVHVVVIWEVSEGPAALVTIALNHLLVQLLLQTQEQEGYQHQRKKGSSQAQYATVQAHSQPNFEFKQ